MELTSEDRSRIDRECDQYVEKLLEGETTGHDISHARRVKICALKLAEKEKADPFKVSLIALLHDVDDPKVFPGENGKLIHAESFLRPRVGEMADSILDDISKISFKGTGKTVPDSIEGKVVQDADRLEAIGFIGIGRAFAYGGAHNRPLMDQNPPRENMSEEEYRKNKGSTINHFYEKLFKLKDLLNTESARRMASYRDSVMRDFVEGFEREWTSGVDVEVFNPAQEEIVLDQEDGERTVVLPSDCLLIYLSGQSLNVLVNGFTVKLGRGKNMERYISLVAGTTITLSCTLDYSRFLLLAI